MRILNLKLLTTLLLIIGLSGCGQETTTVNNNTSSSDSTGNGNSSGSGSGSGSSDSCPYGTGNEAGVQNGNYTTQEYHTIPYEEVVMKGAPIGTVTFDSQTDLSPVYQSKLVSDDRFNIRIIPRRVSKGTKVSNSNAGGGDTCNQIAADWPFTKLSVKFEISSYELGKSTTRVINFENVPLNCASQVYSVDLPPTQNPAVIKISNAMNDQDCLEDAANPGNDRTSNCPMTRVGDLECYGLDIQVATDETLDIPH